MAAGWIKLHRDILEWEWYSHINTRMVFIHCLLRANYEAAEWRGTSIKRGQFIASMETLSEEVGISVRQIRSAISNLKLSNNITTEGRTQFTVITVVDYDSWQTDGEQTETGNGKQKGNQTTTDKETKKKRSKNTFSFRKSLVDLPIDEKIVDDFLMVRQKKKASNSETAFNLLVNEIKKSGKTAQECIMVCVARDWKGFKAEWLSRTGDLFENGSTEFNPKGKHVR